MPDGYLNEDDGATLFCDDCGSQVRTNENHNCPPPETQAMSATEDARAQLIAQLAEGFSKERHRINTQGVGHLPDDLEQYAGDLLDWCNTREEDHDAESLKLLFLFGSSLRFRSFDCGHCGDRCHQGHPDASDGAVDWGDFQGASDNECYTVCDSCHMHSAEAREIEREFEG
jgi:plastocyanin